MADFAKSKARKGDSLPVAIIKKEKTVSGPTLEESTKNDERTLIDLTMEDEQSETKQTSSPNEWYHWQKQEKSNRYQVSNLKKMPTETFREYAVRWTDEAAKVQPPYTENEAIACFVSSLDSELYYQICHQIMDTSETTFANIVKMGETIEIKMMLESTAPKTANVKAQFTNDEKKGKEVHALSHPNQLHKLPSQSTLTPNHNSHYQAPIAPKPDLNPSYNTHGFQPYPPPHVYQAPPRYLPPSKYYPSSSHQPETSASQDRPIMARPHKKVVKTFTPLPEPIGQLFEKLKLAGLIHPIADRTPYPRPAWFDITKNCAYHSGSPGHDTANCHSLKEKIEALIKARVIQIPMIPPYSQSVKGIEFNSNNQEEQTRKFTFPIESQEHLFERLKGAKVLKPLVGDGTSDPPPRLIHGVKYCAYHGEYCQHDAKSCITLRHKIQDLIDDGVLQLAYNDATQNEDDDL